MALAAAPDVALAQGAVSGRVTLQEKPGETTKDIENAVIYLVPKNGAARFSEMKSQMAMSGRAFDPHVRVVTTGSTIEYPNQDVFSHNIFSTAPGATFDLDTYGHGKSKSTQFKKAGAFPIYCNIHSKMTAYVVVVNTPHFTQPSADGRWTLTGVPAGKYEMHVWHERATELVKDLDVASTGTAGADAALDARGFKFTEHKNKVGVDYPAVRY
jgi:plastocyanin